MGTPNPSFFLASTEGYGLDRPRACFSIRRVEGRAWDAYLEVSISPPLTWDDLGLDCGPISRVVLAARHYGASLFPVSAWPVFVFVARPVAGAEQKERFDKQDLDVVAWGELYRTEDEALAAVRR